MNPLKPFTILYAANVKGHLRSIERRYHSLIQDNIVQQLQFEPIQQTRNRKPLGQPTFGADWEIRFGPGNRFRVLYRVDREHWIVYVLAIGEKVGNRLLIGGEEVIS